MRERTAVKLSRGLVTSLAALVIAVATSLCINVKVSAEQLNFATSNNGDSVTFNYQWTDSKQVVHSVSFELPRETIKQNPTLQPNYKPKIAQRYVMVALLKESQKLNPKEAKVSLKRQQDGIDIKVTSPSEEKAAEVLESLQTVQQTAFNTYLDEHYYTRFSTIFNQRAVKPDHLRYINESVKPMVPVSQAFYEKLAPQSNSRDYFALLLSWIQSIPYNAMEDRVASNGSGFVPPIGLLLQNSGDCDSKAVLASSMVRAFLPTTNMIIVFLPNHALLGVALTPMVDDETIEFEGKKYVLYDPTGPAQIPFGQVSESTKQFIDTGRFQIELVK
ncbi:MULTISPECIES: hypothetical protein [unclassified Alteromonas]|jgi:hypothetical protein|uniref:hypothetical protein n=1 Tax=unclassified Alteromonas TaxID=2614992 RepID=UPI000A6CEDEA|nr:MULTISPECIES: hypothetical protein [unclassified Alteromonas]